MGPGRTRARATRAPPHARLEAIAAMTERSASMARRWVLLSVLLAAAASAAFLFTRHRPTDEEQIQSLIHEAARAAEEKRIGDAVRSLSERFEAHGLDRQSAKQLVAFHVLRGTWVSVTVARAKVEVEGDAARAAVDVVMGRSGKGEALAQLLPEAGSIHRFGLWLSREPDGWKVTRAVWRPVSVEEAAAGPELP